MPLRVMQEFVAELKELPKMMAYVESKLAQYQIDKKTRNKVELACEEALVNIVHYAYPDQKGALFIECVKKGNRLEITLKDRGVPFNPIEAPIQPQIETPLPERKPGGLGIFLLRKTIDEVSYQRVVDENILKLVFNV